MSAEELLGRFTNPGAEYGPLPIWWWSGAILTRKRLRWQLEQLVSQGVRQAVVMCLAPTGPLFGSLADDPPFLSPQWIELLDGACADAEELGFKLWMYDQLGFSGANFQGRLTADNPGFAGLALERTGPRVSGFDYFSEEACAALLDQVHGELERQVGHWFGRSIGGFFQDELPAMPTWGSQFAETFEEAYGYDLVPRLAALWAGGDDDSAMVRRDYHEHRARLARKAFFDPLDTWFTRNGLICGFDQPTPAREGDPVGGVLVYGDYLGTHSGYGAPGSDHWGDAKVHSSLAHANGKPRTWIEAFHSSGWGGTLEETYDWLTPFLRRGATLYDPHAVYYSTAGGWWEWAPPSTCWRQPYWPSYHVFATAVARLCSVLSLGTHVCDTVLLSPTTTAQAYLTLDGPLEPARRGSDRYHELNGVNTWFAEDRGVLERAGIDHDVLDENTIAAGEVVPGGLKVGAETYRTVVIPDAYALHTTCAGTLARFAEAGGRVVCVGGPPSLFLGAGSAADPFARAEIVVVDNTGQVPDVVATGPVRVRADVPFLLRKVGDVHVLMLAAHDETSGTKAPIISLDDENWATEGFPWDEYWRQLHESGYTFVPPGERRARVRIDGLTRPRAQRWDPRTGHRTELEITSENNGLLLEVSFEDGSITVVVLGEDLPEATREPLGEIVRTVPVEGPWRALAESTLDNRWGDLAAAGRDGVLPIEVWRLEHSVVSSPGSGDWWAPVTATFGQFAEVRGPDTGWRPAEWSLSRGIRKDPAHEEPLGPKGYVLEEFLDWRDVPAGGRVAVRTHLPLPGHTRACPGLYLAVGAGAARRVWVDGVELPAEGDGYQSFSPLPAGTAGTTVRVEIEFVAEREGPVRASFAVVSDRERYRRPEWLVSAGTSADPSRTFSLGEIPPDCTIQVASDGPCGVLVNGIEVGRQGDFNPYPGHREIRVHPYDLREQLKLGENVIALRVTGSTAAALDSPGLGLLSGADWVSVKLRRNHPRDPRFLCSRARPHPLPGAHWLEPAAAPGGVVEPVIPDSAPGGERVEWLRFAAPMGTTALRIPIEGDSTVFVDDREHELVDNRVEFSEPLAAGTLVLVRVHATGGRRGGALLDAAIEAELAEIETAAATLFAGWEELGLRALGGQVRYRTTIEATPADRTVLDLGEVRGTADVLVNGELVDRLIWGPWRTEVTEALRPGGNELEIVVRGTLAGYLDDASPTAAVVAGQVRTGLFGPVQLIGYGAEKEVTV